MKDSTDNKGLDQYGVWVKKTSKESANDNSTSSENTDLSLPDFSFLDDISADTAKSDELNKNGDFETEETSLTPDELSNIAVSASDDISDKKVPPAAGEEEISLDDFITGGFTDEPSKDNESKPSQENIKPAETKQEDGEVSLDEFLSDSPSSTQESSSTKNEDVSVDDFLGSSKSTSNDEVSLDDFLDSSSSEKSPKEDEIEDENPMNIDLSFDDSMNLQDDKTLENSNTDSTAAVNSTESKTTIADNTEEIDMSSFDTPSSDVKRDSETTEVNLDDFDSQFNNIVDENESSNIASEPKANEQVENSNTESVDLSDFGIDENSEEKNVILPSSEPKEMVKEDVDYEMNVSTDDDSGVSEQITGPSSSSEQEENVKLETEPEVKEEKKQSNEEIISSIDTSSPADDFDIDEIMNSVKDEQGKTVCIGKTADAIAKDVDTVSLEENKNAPEEIHPESIQDLNDISTSEESSIEKTIPISVENDSTPTKNENCESLSDIEETHTDDSKDILDYLPDNIATTVEKVEKNEDADENINSSFDSINSESEQDTEKIPKELDENILDSVANASEQENEEISSTDLNTTTLETTENNEHQESPSEDISKENHDILNKIATELASLKDEINGLKTEFEDLKNNSSIPSEISSKKADKEEGFFAGNDEDDTIALSGDELNNILNNADFTSPKEVNETVETTTSESADQKNQIENVEPVEDVEQVEKNEFEETSDKTTNVTESPLGALDTSLDIPEQDDYETDNGLKMDFSNEKLEEPVFDNLDLNSNVEPEPHEDEISVPKVDDILVESSNSDLMESNVTSGIDNNEPEETQTLEEDAETLPLEEEQTANVDNFEEPKVEESNSNVNNEAISKPINLFKEEEPVEITDDNLNYLSEEPKQEVPTEQVEDLQEENSSTEDNEPVDSVFDQWGKPSEENSFEEPQTVEQKEDKEDTAEELKSEDVEALKPVANNTNTTSANNSTIPSDMKQEIKSVLSYMDQLLENLPEDKITEFAQSKQFETYKKLFSELGLA